MSKYFACISLLALGLAGHAHADDVVPEFSWGGAYVGGQVGGSWADSDISSNLHAGSFIIPPMGPLSLSDGSLLRFSPDPSGFIGGVYAGYNFDLGNDVIVGIESDIAWGDVAEQTGYDSFDMNPLNGGAGGYLNACVNVEQKWSGATRLRVGYAMDRFLPYVAAGFAYGKVKSSTGAYLSPTPGGTNPYPAATGDPNAATYNFSNSSTFTGWTLGTGADYAITDNVLLRLEYRYTDYGDKTYKHTIPGGGTSAISYKLDHKINDIRVGVAYKF